MAVRPAQLTAKKTPVGPIVVIVVVVAAAAAAGWYFILRPTPQRAVKAYLRAAEAGDTAAMEAMLSADTLKLLNIIGGGAASANAMKAPVPTEATYTLGETKIEGDKATVFVEYAGNAAAPSTVQGQGVAFVVVKEDGQWKIDLLPTLLMQGLGNAGGDLATDLSNVMRDAFSQPRR